jgi:ferrous iron transport protein B
MVAVDLLLGHLRHPPEPRPDVVVSIVDASNIDRNLYLTTQVLELGVPVVVALNMIDLAEGQGVRIDAEELSRRLGVPVVPIQANRGRGLDRLKEAIARTADAGAPSRRVAFPDEFEREVRQLRDALDDDVPDFLVRRTLLDVGGYTEQRLAARHEGIGERVAARSASPRPVVASPPWSARSLRLDSPGDRWLRSPAARTTRHLD